MQEGLKKKLRISLAGYFFYYVAPIRKQIVQDNINRVFKDQLTVNEKIKLAKAFYSHLATTLKELLFMGWRRANRLDDSIAIKGINYLHDAHKQEHGCFLLSAHLGNWEMASLVAFSRLTPSFGPFHIIRKAIRVKWIERLFFSRTERYGIKRIDKSGASRQIIKAIKNKQTVLFAMDQHAQLKNSEGIAVNFFNKKAGTFRSLAFLSNKFQVPVVPVSCYRLPDYTHMVEFHPPLKAVPHPDAEQALFINTLRYNQQLEKLILEHPEQWWWVHRRWKL